MENLGYRQQDWTLSVTTLLSNLTQLLARVISRKEKRRWGFTRTEVLMCSWPGTLAVSDTWCSLCWKSLLPHCCWTSISLTVVMTFLANGDVFKSSSDLVRIRDLLRSSGCQQAWTADLNPKVSWKHSVSRNLVPQCQARVRWRRALGCCCGCLHLCCPRSSH